MNTWTKRFLLVVFSAAVATILAEVVLRIIEKPQPPITFSAFSSHLEKHRLADFMHTVESDPDVFWKLKPNQSLPEDHRHIKGLVSNASGLREAHEIPFKATNDTIRILCLGDSCTFGFGVLENQGFVEQTERLLQARHPELHLELINAGVPGYSIYQGWRYLETEGLKYRPALVITTFGWNDQRKWSNMSDLDQYRFRQASDPGPLLRRSQVCRKVATALASRQVKTPEQEKLRVSPEDFALFLDRIEETTREHQADHLVMIWPHRTHFHSDGSIRTTLYDEVMLDFAPRAGAGVLDLRLVFQQALKDHSISKLLIDYGHAKPLGNRVIAEALADRIETWLATYAPDTHG